MNHSALGTLLDREICASVWNSPHPPVIMNRLCHEIGPRPPGTPEMQAAQAYLKTLLDEIGVGGLRQECVPLPGWKPEPSQLEMCFPIQRKYESVQHVNTCAADVSGRLVEVESATEANLDRAGSALENAVVLLRGHISFGQKYTPYPIQMERLTRRGVRGVITRSSEVEGCPGIRLFGFDDVIPIPAVAVSPGAASELHHYAQTRKAEVRLITRGQRVAARCSNLLGELSPPGARPEALIISAHLDTFHLNPGALDNLTGVVTLLEIVRALAPLHAHFQRKLLINIYTGEEYGFLGSKSYVRDHFDELDAIRFVLNLDMLWPATAEGMAVIWSPSMRDYIEGQFRQTQRRVDVRNLFCMSSDYLPFVLAGVPAGRPASLAGPMPPWYHTTEDTAEKVPVDWIRSNAMVFGQLLARMLADPAPLPAGRLTPEEVQLLLRQEGVVEELRSMGFPCEGCP